MISRGAFRLRSIIGRFNPLRTSSLACAKAIGLFYTFSSQLPLVLGFLMGRPRTFRSRDTPRFQNSGEALVSRVLLSEFGPPYYHLVNRVTIQTVGEQADEIGPPCSYFFAKKASERIIVGTERDPTRHTRR